METYSKAVPGAARALVTALALGLMWLVVAVGSFASALATEVGAGSLSVLGAGTAIKQVSESTIPATNKVREVSLSLTYIAPSRYPLDTIRRRAAARGKMVRVPSNARNVKHEWFEADVIPRASTVNGTVSGGSTSDTVVVDDAYVFRKGDLAYLPDNSAAAGHILFVEAVSANGLSLTVSRVNTSASEDTFQNTVAIGDGEAIYKLGPGHQEASTVGNGIGTYAVPKYNFYQIKDQVIDYSGTKRATSEYGINSVDLSERQALLDYRRSMEVNSIFGQRFDGSFSSQDIRFQHGITQYITSNLITYTAGSMTEANIIDWMKQLFADNNGSAVRYWFPTPTQQTEVTKLVANSNGLRWDRDTEVLGLKCGRIKSDFGELYMFPSQELEEHGKTNWGLVLDPANVGWVTLRDLKRMDGSTPGADSTVTRWLEESTLEVNHEATHGIIYATATDSPR